MFNIKICELKIFFCYELRDELHFNHLLLSQNAGLVARC